jgi:hypothetical protein
VFDQPLSDGSKMRITGGSLDNVLELILRFRLEHLILLPSGTEATPEAVSNDYHGTVCAAYPWLCRPTSGGGSAPPGQYGPVFVPLFTRMLENLNGLKASVPAFVDMQSATNRANACMQCPQNILWETNCGTCNQNLTALAYAIRGGRRLNADSGLRGCRAFGTLLAVSVWLQEPGGDNKYQQSAPVGLCWRLPSLVPA